MQRGTGRRPLIFFTHEQTLQPPACPGDAAPGRAGANACAETRISRCLDTDYQRTVSRHEPRNHAGQPYPPTRRSAALRRECHRVPSARRGRCPLCLALRAVVALSDRHTGHAARPLLGPAGMDGAAVPPPGHGTACLDKPLPRQNEGHHGARRQPSLSPEPAPLL